MFDTVCKFSFPSSYQLNLEIRGFTVFLNISCQVKLRILIYAARFLQLRHEHELKQQHAVQDTDYQQKTRLNIKVKQVLSVFYNRNVRLFLHIAEYKLITKTSRRHIYITIIYICSFCCVSLNNFINTILI